MLWCILRCIPKKNVQKLNAPFNDNNDNKKCAERESYDGGFQNERGSLMLLLEEIRQAEKQADAPQ